MPDLKPSKIFEVHDLGSNFAARASDQRSGATAPSENCAAA